MDIVILKNLRYLRIFVEHSKLKYLKKMINKKEKNYISPEIEVTIIEVEQSILASSIEKLGDRLEDQEW